MGHMQCQLCEQASSVVRGGLCDRNCVRFHLVLDRQSTDVRRDVYRQEIVYRRKYRIDPPAWPIAELLDPLVHISIALTRDAEPFHDVASRTLS